MVERCFFCQRGFGANSVLESFPGARRIAYDPIRGRLWCVCGRCGRWSLAPIDARWEVLEALERITRDRARMLGETENIGLYSIGDARIVRVGRAGLREEAWWRYTRELGRRRVRARRIVRRGKVREAAIMLLLVGVPFWGIRSEGSWIDRARRRELGGVAWRGEAECARCGRMRQSLAIGDPIRVSPNEADPRTIVLHGRCASCGSRDGAGFRLPDDLSEPLLRRCLAWRNFGGVPDAVLDEAVRSIENEATPSEFVRRLAGPGLGLHQLTEESSVAFEIAVNEKFERHLLSLELAALEAQWRREEEVAAIADGELS